jgi:hypothetical protein
MAMTVMNLIEVIARLEGLTPLTGISGPRGKEPGASDGNCSGGSNSS